MTITSIQTRCPHCQKAARVKPNYLGQVVSCKRCKGALRISTHVLMSCPNCRSDLRVRPERIGQLVACKNCSHTFRAESAGDSLFAPSVPWSSPAPPTPTDRAAEPDSPVTKPEAEIPPSPAQPADRSADAAATGERL